MCTKHCTTPGGTIVASVTCTSQPYVHMNLPPAPHLWVWFFSYISSLSPKCPTFSKSTYLEMTFSFSSSQPHQRFALISLFPLFQSHELTQI